METQARFVLIGGFAMAGVLGILGFVLWFASVEVDRQFSYYQIDFQEVAGLSTASVVRFNGFPVGQVVSMELAPDQSGRIRVRIEIDKETPVRTSTAATVESQGVTGVGFVALSTDDQTAPLLSEVSTEDVPSIPGERSTLQVLSQDAPKIVEETLEVARQLRQLLGEENQARITAIFENLDASSADLSLALDNFSTVTETIATASEEIAAFTTRLEAISEAATGALETADTTLQQVTELAQRAEASLDVGDAAMESGRTALDTANAFIGEDLPALISDLTETTAHVREQVDLVTTDARAMIEDFRTTGVLASDRLAQAEATLDSADTMLAQMTETLASVDDASQSLATLIDGDGAALVADLRSSVAEANDLIASATEVAETDLPAIVSDIRSATEAAARAVEQVSADLTEAVGRVEGLSEEASNVLVTAADTFSRANVTIKGLNAAIETGDRALAAADRAFVSADEIVREDITAIIAELDQSLGQFDEALASISADLPEITAELRTTVERANSAIGQFESAVASAAGPVREFASDGLPQYTRLAQETRGLVETIEQLVRNIERDPARYFLGGDEPVFRR